MPEQIQSIVQFMQDPSHFAEAIANVSKRQPGTELFEKKKGISHVGLYREILSNKNVLAYFAEHLPDIPTDTFQSMLQFFGIKANDIHVFFDNERPRFYAMQQPLKIPMPFEKVDNATGVFSWEHNRSLNRDEFRIAGIHDRRVYSARYIHSTENTDLPQDFILDELRFGVRPGEPLLNHHSSYPIIPGSNSEIITRAMMKKTNNCYGYTISQPEMDMIFGNQIPHPGVQSIHGSLPRTFSVAKK